VGAGDSMLAGFVYGLDHKMSPSEALAFGSACSTLTITVPGYPRLILEEVYEVVKKARVYEI